MTYNQVKFAEDRTSKESPVKICPTCHQTYTDASLNFCLADGAVLNQLNNQPTDSPTVFMPQPPVTGQSPAFHTNPSNVWGNPSTLTPVRPPKKSKAWIWIVGILAGLLVVGAIGVVGIIALVATQVEDKADKYPTPTPEKKNSSALTDDFSKTNWLKANNNNGDSEYRNGEFFVNSKQSGYFYVLVTGNKDFKTWNSVTTLIARNVNASSTNLGYGLVVHSNPAVALDKDYAFLIDSVKQSYRVVQHLNKQEKILVSWTRFPGIRSGMQTNEIQVRDENGKMSMYINGQFATSLTDSVSFKDGVAGVYASDAAVIAFSNLQLGK
jgi:hypothetical protein